MKIQLGARAPRLGRPESLFFTKVRIFAEKFKTDVESYLKNSDAFLIIYRCPQKLPLILDM